MEAVSQPRDFTIKPKFSSDMLEELLFTLYNDHNEALRNYENEKYFVRIKFNPTLRQLSLFIYTGVVNYLFTSYAKR